MDYKIVIPTYKRNETINKKTLKILRESDIDNSIIYIFVANQEEYNLYINSLNKNDYGKIIIGELGLKNQRNFIGNYFNQDEKLLFMDDDIKGLIAGYYDRENNEIIKLKIPSLNKLIINSFNECIEQKCNLFGFYPTDNYYFLRPTFDTSLKYIIGSMYGIINKQDRQVNTDDKEDFERTLKYFVNDGKVLRINFIGIKTDYFTEKGGLQETRTNETIENGALYVYNKYPFLTSIIYKKRKNKTISEIKLNNKIDTKLLRYEFPSSDYNNELKQKLFKSIMEMKMPKPRIGLRCPKKGKQREHYERANIIMDEADINNPLLNFGSMTFGYGLVIGLGPTEYLMNKKHPEIYKMIIEYGKLISPKGKPFSAITINKNIKCKYHKDGINVGPSVFITLGDYTGGGIMIEGQYYDDVRNTITIFNGHNLKHATQPFEGDRVAIIYYNILKNPPTEFVYYGENENQPTYKSIIYDTKI